MGGVKYRNTLNRCDVRSSSLINFLLVVSTPLKNISQIGNLPQVGVKMKNLRNHQPDFVSIFDCSNPIISFPLYESLPQKKTTET